MKKNEDDTAGNYSQDANYKLAELLYSSLLDKNLHISFAESCTGGLVSSLLTDVPGSSQVLLGSIVSYSNEAKHNLLNVSNHNLNLFGAVSEEVAIEMAKGVKKVFGVDIGVSITGIAGPGGATMTKPVGLVYISAIYNESVVVKKYNFNGTRKEIKLASAQKALEIALNMVKNILRRNKNNEK